LSTMIHSVVRIIAAIEATFWRADRVTFAESVIQS
jgi:hypothetical protein